MCIHGHTHTHSLLEASRLSRFRWQDLQEIEAPKGGCPQACREEGRRVSKVRSPCRGAAATVERAGRAGVPAGSLGERLQPALTSHIQVGRGRVACARGVGGHTLVLALVRLLAALNLQSTCGDRESEVRPETRPKGSGAPVAAVD